MILGGGPGTGREREDNSKEIQNQRASRSKVKRDSSTMQKSKYVASDKKGRCKERKKKSTRKITLDG